MRPSAFAAVVQGLEDASARATRETVTPGRPTTRQIAAHAGESASDSRPGPDGRRARAQRIGEAGDADLRRLLLTRGAEAAADEPAHNVRRARMIAYALDHYPVVIDDGDLLVGKPCAEPLDAVARRELEAKGDVLSRLFEPLRYGPGNGGTGGHRTIDFETLMAGGVDGVRAEVERRDRAGEGDASARDFRRAALVALDGLLRFAARYRATLETRAREAADPARRAAFEELAAVFSRIPAAPPRTFREAIQSAWFVQFAMRFDDISCTGHSDDYLRPFYERDVREGTLTRDDALVLIEELYLRSNETFGRWPETILLGGTARDGRPVANDLTRLFLEAVGRVRLVNPNVGLCLRDDTPDDLVDLGLSLVAQGLSHPAFYNDRVIIDGLVAAGLAVEDARRYQNSTCVEITPVGCSNVQVAAARVYRPRRCCFFSTADGRWSRIRACAGR